MPKQRKKPKRLLYLRAFFSEPDEGQTALTLEQYLAQAYEKLPKVKDRIVEFAGQKWTGGYYSKRSDCFYIQFSAATPGEAATTVPTNGLDVENVELGTAAPPPDREFSDGDIICCVSGDHIFACLTNLRDNKIEAYLMPLFKQAELEKRAELFRIDKPADFDKIKIIKEAGVKKIRLNASLGDAEFLRLEDLGGESLMSKLIQGLMAKDKKLTETIRDNGGRFKVELSTEAKRGDVTPATEWIDTIAEEALQEEDAYRIETQDGKVITQQEITISRKEWLAPFGKTVFLSEAMAKLEAFKNEFMQSRKIVGNQ